MMCIYTISHNANTWTYNTSPPMICTFLKKCTNSLSNSVGKMATCRSANAGNGEAWALLLAPFPLLPEAAFPLGGTVDMICATLSCSIVHMSCTVNVTGTIQSSKSCAISTG